MDMRVVEQLQNNLDQWAATVYPSSEERERTLRSILAPHDDLAAEQFVALSRARDRLASISEILEDAWNEKGRVTDWDDLQESDLDDWREPTATPPKAEEEAQSEEAVPSEMLREMEYLHGYYPRWLKRDLVDDFFPWHQAQETLMSTFLDQYTLHDSHLVGLWLTCDGGLLAVIQWDTVHVNFDEDRVDFWLEDHEVDPLVSQHYGDDVAYWPYLLIRFPKLHSLHVLDTPGGASEFDPSIIWSATSAPTSDGDSLYETALEGGVREAVRFVHAARVAILCLNRAGRVVTIPDL